MPQLFYHEQANLQVATAVYGSTDQSLCISHELYP